MLNGTSFLSICVIILCTTPSDAFSRVFLSKAILIIKTKLGIFKIGI